MPEDARLSERNLDQLRQFLRERFPDPDKKQGAVFFVVAATGWQPAGAEDFVEKALGPENNPTAGDVGEALMDMLDACLMVSRSMRCRRSGKCTSTLPRSTKEADRK